MRAGLFDLFAQECGTKCGRWMKEPFFPRKSCPPSVQTSSLLAYTMSHPPKCAHGQVVPLVQETQLPQTVHMICLSHFPMPSMSPARQVPTRLFPPSPASIRFIWACQKNSVLIQNASATKSPHNSLWKNRERESDTQQMQIHGCHITTHCLETWLVVSKAESKQPICQKVLCHRPWEIHEEEEWQLLQKSRQSHCWWWEEEGERDGKLTWGKHANLWRCKSRELTSTDGYLIHFFPSFFFPPLH